MRHAWWTNARRTLAAAAAAALMAGGAAASAATAYPFTTQTTDKVNMRRSASSTSVVLDRLPAGAAITVTGTSGNYYKVTWNGRSGYILKPYVQVTEEAAVTPAPTEAPTVTGYPYMTTTNDQVNLREKASTRSAKLRSIPKGAEVEVLGVTKSFAHVRYRNTEGYAVKSYVDLKEIVKPTKAPKATAAPTTAPQASLGFVTLKTGSSGQAVTALQSALNELGYLRANPDGEFGASTESAVRAFQSRNGYPVTGEADANLQAFLYNGKPLNTSGTATSVKTLAPLEGVTVRPGNKGEFVGTIQIRLRELGYYTGEITMVHDTATVAAAKAFQKKNSLTADGKVGTLTQNVLFSASAVPANGGASGAEAVVTPEPTPAPTFAKPADKVTRGSSGADARLVQNRLRALGYYTGSVDGKFGSGSVAALKAFQSNNGLKADGVAGPATVDLLFSYGALAAGQTATPAPTATPVPTPTPSPTPLTRENAVVIKLGVSGDEVLRLQRRLTELGYYTAAMDGVCKADDVAAIKTFQSKNGLKADGAAGYDTQSVLYSDTATLYSGANVGVLTGYNTLRLGMTGTEVANMQKRLIALHYLFGTADGIYGSETANAVIAFQKNNGLVRDGVAGPTTLQKLYGSSAVAAVVATPTPAPAAQTKTAAASTTLRQGDSSNAVREMQQRLIDLGYLTGKADGKFGARTYSALVAFQRANGLKADGIAGENTLSKLNSTTAVGSGGKAAATPTPTAAPKAASNPKVSASQVRYANWYSEVKAKAKKYPYVTVYDYTTGVSWQEHIFSVGAHADAEPLTASDTAKMESVFGGNTWNPRAVWVVFGDGTVYMASTHSMPHEVQHNRTNNFEGHLCIHFPRTAAQVAAIGSYATSHQAAIDKGWQVTQAMIK